MLEKILASIEHHQYAVYQNLITAEQALQLRQYMDLHYEAENFKRAGVGKGARFEINENIRSDSVMWVDNPKEPLLHSYFAFLEELIPVLNRYFFVPIKDKEIMLALYEKGNFYKRHRDRFERNGHRLFTVLLYLTDWQQGDGGELMIYNGHQIISVLPKAGTFLIFNSLLEHEVLMTNKRRYSITGWYTDVPIGLTFL